MAYIVMAYIVMVCIVMAYIVMAYMVMAPTADEFEMRAEVVVVDDQQVRRWRCDDCGGMNATPLVPKSYRQ